MGLKADTTQPSSGGPDNKTAREGMPIIQNLQTAEQTKPRIQWGKSLVNFATAIWVIATILVGPVMLAKLAYRLSIGDTNPAAHAAIQGVFFGIIFMLILGGCIERKLR